MNESDPSSACNDVIPPGLVPHFQEYNVAELDLTKYADLVIQRTLEFGNWEDLRWLFTRYGNPRIRDFLRLFGERWLRPVTFNYWRRLLSIRKWRHSPFLTPREEVWPW